MKQEDKNKLKAAFMKAINESPYADDPIEGMIFDNGPATSRKIIAHALEDDGFFAEVDKILEDNKITLDQYIAASTPGLKQPVQRIK